MKKPNYFVTLSLAAAIGYFTVQNRFGFLLGILFPLLLIYFLVGAIALIVKKENRRPRAIRMSIWLLLLVVSVAIQAHWANAARLEADGVVQAVQAFRSRTGAYPQTLADVHLDENRLAQRWMLRYRLIDGKPSLAYASNFIPLDMFVFDFDGKTWGEESY